MKVSASDFQTTVARSDYEDRINTVIEGADALFAARKALHEAQDALRDAQHRIMRFCVDTGQIDLLKIDEARLRHVAYHLKR